MMAGSALGFGGEDLVEGRPWHHDDITMRALAGNDPRYEGAGFSRGAALGVAWASDYLDSYLYNPLYYLKPVDNRFTAAMIGHPELVKLHFDDIFSTSGITGTWQRYASGTLIGLYWASLQGVSGDVDLAHHVLGVSLHAVQDFYSHSSWVDDPSRRCTTWTEFAPESRQALSLSTGAYELIGSGAPNLHGQYSLSCSIVGNTTFTKPLEVICSGLSPLQNASFCEAFRACSDSADIPAVLDGTYVDNVIRISEPGIAIDSTWMAEVQAKNRPGIADDGSFERNFDGMHFPEAMCEPIIGVKRAGLCNPASIQLFAGAKDLAIRASMEWIAWLDDAMQAMGPREAAFWERVKTQGSNVPNQRLGYEDFAKLPYLFLTAGPYPIGNSSTPDQRQPSDAGWYLRLEIETANVANAGTNADIYAEIDGDGWSERILLDRLPGELNPIVGYDDFEQGDHDAYVVGPLPGQPSVMRLASELPSIVRSYWTEYAEDIEAVIEELRTDLISLVQGNADLVGSNKLMVSTPEVVTMLSTANAADRFLKIDGGINGEFDIVYRIRPTQFRLTAEEAAAGWQSFEVELRRLDGIRESTVDRFSTSDEPFVIFLVSPLNGQSDAIQAYLSDPIPDFDAGDRHVFARRTGSSSIVKVPPEGGVVISAQIYESDSESAADRDRLRRIYESGLDAVEEERDEQLLAALNAAFAADWEPKELDVFAFRRGDTPMAGTVLKTSDLPIIEGNTTSQNLGLDFSAVRTLGSPDSALINWSAERPDPKLTLAGKWFAHNLPCDPTKPSQWVEFTFDGDQMVGTRQEDDDCAERGELAINGTYADGTIDATINLGEKDDAETVPDVRPIFRDPAIDRNIDYEGAWYVEWLGDSQEPPARVVLDRGVSYHCPTGGQCGFQRDPNAGWVLSVYTEEGRGVPGSVTFSDGAMKIDYPYDHLGSQGGKSTVQQEADWFHDRHLGLWRS